LIHFYKRYLVAQEKSEEKNPDYSGVRNL